jgi:hypothetical protein
VAAGELVGERAELVERAVVVLERPRGSEPAADAVARVLGEVMQDVARSL